MALPYAAIALIPGLQRLVPKPGRWMGAFKTILALLMAGMSGYLAALVGATFSLNASYILLIALFVVIGLLVRKALLFGLLAVSLFAYPVWDNVSSKETASASVWVKFEPDKIANLVAAGKTVVIDISAKWCITCKINDQTVWNRDDVGKALSGTNVVAMRGDWTRPDPVIADYLKSFNRYGLPFNIVYSPSQPKGVLLPELLSKKDIFDAIGDHAK
jgi:suppressor for copper-sensitivity B